MPPKIRTSLIVVQTVIAVISLLMFGGGLFGVRAVRIIEENQKKSYEMGFEEKMRPYVGKTYTEERHYILLELMTISDDVKSSTNESLLGASQLLRNVGGLFTLCALASIFLILKKPRPPNKRKIPNHTEDLPFNLSLSISPINFHLWLIPSKSR
jgi:hypothetical protein